MASTRISGITIEIGGDTTKLQDSLKAVDKRLSATKSELKDVDKLLRLDPKNTELLRQKQERLGSEIKDTKTRLQELQNAQEQVGEGTKEWDTLQREIVATEQDLKGLEGQMKGFGSVTAQELKAVGENLQNVGGKITSVGDALTPISKAAAGAIAGLGGLAYKAVTGADDLATLSKQTGISVEELQKMQYASGLVDVSVEDMTGALKKLKPKITEDNEALADLGVSTKNADGSTRDAIDVFYDAIAALSNIENETERDQKAMELFGRGADSLAGIIDDGGAALRKFGQEAEDVGAVMSGKTVDSLTAVADTVDRFKGQGGAALAKLGASVAKVLAPSLNKILGIIGKVTKAIDNLTPEHAEMILKILGITASIAPLLKVGGKLISGIGKALTLAPKIATAVKLVGAAMSPTTLIIAAIVAAVVALGVIIYKNWDKIKAWTLDMVANVKAAWESLKASITNLVTNITTGVVDAWTNIKTSVTNLVTGIKDSVVNVWTNIKTSITNTLTALKSSIAEKWENIKKSVSEKVQGIVDKVKSLFSFNFTLPKLSLPTWEDIKGTLNTIIDNVKGLFSFDFSLPGLKLPTWEDIKATLDEIVRKAKEVFKFDWSLPKIKLPHFRVQGGKWPYGLGGEGYLPQISIDWYKKAYENAVMFTRPTVMATPYGAKGFGDGTGAEIVMGLNKLRELVGTGNVTVNVYGAPGQNVNELADAVTQRIISLQKQRASAYA